MVAQIASVHQVHDKVQVLSVLKCIKHIYQEGMLEVAQQVPFIQHRNLAFLRYYADQDG